MAVGDSLGLPREGISARRARRMFGPECIKHQFFFGHGMISDDTEHAIMTAQALLVGGDNVDRFLKSLAWRLRFWLLGIPAGIGLGTLRAILKLWIGFPPARSGVHSAGNGPAMRAPIIGTIFANDPETMLAMLKASTAITHRDLRAEEGSLAIAAAASWATTHGAEGVASGDALRCVQTRITDRELLELLQKVEMHLDHRSSPKQFAADLGLADGVSGYIYHTVPIALFCWLRFPGDFRESVGAAIRLGGDTDTVGGIVGALGGISSGA